jgi:hypothetical protein
VTHSSTRSPTGRRRTLLFSQIFLATFLCDSVSHLYRRKVVSFPFPLPWSKLQLQGKLHRPRPTLLILRANRSETLIEHLCRRPKVASERSGSTYPKFGWLNTLKASARNCRLTPSCKENCRRTAKLACVAPNPRTKLRGALPVSLPVVDLNAARFSARPPGYARIGGAIEKQGLA